MPPRPSLSPLAGSVLLCLLGACDFEIERGRADLATPPLSGDVEIDMSGSWVAAAVDHLNTPDGRTPPPPAVQIPRGSVFPPGAGMEIRLDDAGISHLGGFPVSLRHLHQSGGQETYVNHSDGKIARLSYRHYPNASASHPDVILELILGSVDGETMRGYVFYTGIVTTLGQRPPDGLFSFTLHRTVTDTGLRVSVPAPGSPAHENHLGKAGRDLGSFFASPRNRSEDRARTRAPGLSTNSAAQPEK